MRASLVGFYLSALSAVSATPKSILTGRQDTNATAGCSNPAVRKEWRDLDAAAQQVGDSDKDFSTHF